MGYFFGRMGSNQKYANSMEDTVKRRKTNPD
jgi:hypothetical protein